MNEQDTSRCPSEIQEIERHKYFLSEKAGFDVGWEAAETDWETHFAEQWRERQAEEASGAECPAESAEDCESVATVAESARPATTREQSPAPRENGAAKPGWFARLFSRNYTVR
jgi:hypothetical protein